MTEIKINAQGLTPEEAYRKKRVRQIVIGLMLALMCGLFSAAAAVFNGAVAENIAVPANIDTFADNVISALIILGIAEFVAGIGGIIVTLSQGKTMTDAVKIVRVKSSRILILGGFLAGGLGTSLMFTSVVFCGATYTYTAVATAPIWTVIISKIFLKERINVRVVLGVCVIVAGAIIACIAPPEQVSHFAIGMFLAFVTALCWASDAVIEAHGFDTVDSMESITIYRFFTSGLIDFALAAVVGLVSGNIETFGMTFQAILAGGPALVAQILVIIAIFGNYLGVYNAIDLCGASRANALQALNTGWTIPVGLFCAAVGLGSYNVTPLGIIAALVAVFGVILVTIKPSELFNLRDVD